MAIEGLTPAEEKEFDKGVLDAIDSGLETAGKTGSKLESEPSVEDPDPKKAANPEPAPEPTATSEPNEAETDPEPEPESKADPKEPTEKIAAGEDPEGVTPVSPAEEDPAASSPEEPKEIKPSDEFGELEDDATPKTKERFATMKTKFDEVSTELGRVSQQNNDWMDTIKQTGASPEQLGASLAYLEDINTNTLESLERAYHTMEDELKVLGERLGKEAPGFDPLDAHADLKKRVDDGYIDRADALEIAQGRARTNVAADLAARTKQTVHLPMSQDEGVQSIANLGARLRAADPNYDQKLTALQDITKQVVSSGAEPSTWAKTIELTYKAIPKLQTVTKIVPAPVPNSIRPGVTGKTEFKKEPGSLLEAVDQSLARGY